MQWKKRCDEIVNLNYSERLFGVIVWGQFFITGLHCRACAAACVLQVLATLFLAQLHVNIWVGRKLWPDLCLQTGIAVNLVCMSSECVQSRRLLNLSGCSVPELSPCECCPYFPHPIRLSLAVLVTFAAAHSVPPSCMAGGCPELPPTLSPNSKIPFPQPCFILWPPAVPVAPAELPPVSASLLSFSAKIGHNCLPQPLFWGKRPTDNT